MCLKFVFEVRGDLRFGDGILFRPFWTVSSVMPVNGLCLMSFLFSVPLLLSWWQVSQCTKEDRQPGACGTLLPPSLVLKHISERFSKWLPDSPLPQFPHLCDEDKGCFPEARVAFTS